MDPTQQNNPTTDTSVPVSDAVVVEPQPSAPAQETTTPSIQPVVDEPVNVNVPPVADETVNVNIQAAPHEQVNVNIQPPVNEYNNTQQQYYAPQPPVAKSPKDKTTAGILAILLGAFGVHKFYLGYTTPAVIMLVVSIVGACLVVGPAVMGIIGLIEGILYLTKSDEEFQNTYVNNQKFWF